MSKAIDREALAAAVTKAADALVTFWNAESEIEEILGCEVDDLKEGYIESIAVAGGEADDETVDQLIQYANEELEEKETDGGVRPTV